MNNELRKEVRALKAFQSVRYKELAELLEIRIDSFYNWLSGYYNLGEQKQRRLKEIIDTLKE